MQKIAPFLWFDGKAEEAARFYVSIFRNSRIGEIRRSSGRRHEQSFHAARAVCWIASKRTSRAVSRPAVG